jgi:hypothetical protein
MGKKLSLKHIGYSALVLLSLSGVLYMASQAYEWNLLSRVAKMSLLFGSVLFSVWFIKGMARIEHRQRRAIAVREDEKKVKWRQEFMELSKEQRQFKLHSYLHSLRTASRMTTWSYVGIVLPLGGWILAGLGASFLKSIPYGLSDNLDRRVRGIRSNLRMSILLSLIVSVFYVVGYSNTYNNSLVPARPVTAQYEITQPQTNTSAPTTSSQPNSVDTMPTDTSGGSSTGPVNCSSSSFGSTGTTNCYGSSGSVYCSSSNLGSTGSANCYGSDGSSANCYSSNFGSTGSTNCYGSGGSTSCYSNNIGGTSYSNCYGPGGSTSCSTSSIGTMAYTNCY